MKRRNFNIEESAYIIEASKISKQYDTGTLQVHALKDLSMQVARGEVVAIMGPSGCGKTTLLNCLSGLDSIDDGSVKIAGCDLSALNDNELTEFRARQMGFIFQAYNLLPVLTGLENVELPMLISDFKPKEARQRALNVIEQVGVGPWARHRPGEMSGGQRQRFTIARALATQPAIVWADEPTGALDSETSLEIVDLMLKLNQEHGQTFVWVTHSMDIASRAHSVINMRDGQIIEDNRVTQQYQPTSTGSAQEAHE